MKVIKNELIEDPLEYIINIECLKLGLKPLFDKELVEKYGSN